LIQDRPGSTKLRLSHKEGLHYLPQRSPGLKDSEDPTYSITKSEVQETDVFVARNKAIDKILCIRLVGRQMPRNFPLGAPISFYVQSTYSVESRGTHLAALGKYRGS
jgi:hypothetical protein